MSVPSAETPVVFDPAAIDRLRQMAGTAQPGFVAEMAQLFLEESAKSLNDLRTGCEQNDWKRVSRVAHSLKSSAATLGLMRLARACRELELDTLTPGCGQRTPSLVAGVLEEFEQAAPILKGLP